MHTTFRLKTAAEKYITACRKLGRHVTCKVVRGEWVIGVYA